MYHPCQLTTKGKLFFTLVVKRIHVRLDYFRGANPPGGGRRHTHLPNLSKNCMKLRKFWCGGLGG